MEKSNFFFFGKTSQVIWLSYTLNVTYLTTFKNTVPYFVLSQIKSY